MKKTLFIVLILTSLGISQYSNLGTAGAQFLQIPVGARAAGMGGAVAASINDASSLFWNPSGIVNIDHADIHFTNINWFDMFDLNAMAAVYNLEGFGSLGVSFTSFGTGKIEITTEKQPNGTGRYYDAQDIAAGLTYARRLTDRFNAGITVKYVYQRIWNETAGGIAFDIGTQYTLDFNNFTIAMSMTNFGADLRFDGPDLNVTLTRDPNLPLSRLAPGRLQTEDYPLPLHFQVGVAMDVYQNEFMKFRAGIDVAHPNDNNERIHLGGEFSFFDRIFLRGGYKYNYDVEKYSFGAGANLPAGDTWLKFDYSYSVYDILPDVQRISLGVRF